MSTSFQFPSVQMPLVREKGLLTNPWYLFFLNIYNNVAGGQPTLTAGSTSGNVTFNQPFQTPNYKKAIIYCDALTGTANYKFPTPFTHIPQILTTDGPAAAVVTSLTTANVTITGSATTGYIILEGN